MNEKRRIDLFLPQISDTTPTTNDPTPKPEKKIIFERTGSPLDSHIRSHYETIVASQKDSS